MTEIHYRIVTGTVINLLKQVKIIDLKLLHTAASYCCIFFLLVNFFLKLIQNSLCCLFI